MKTKTYYTYLFSFLFTLFITDVFGWGTDVLVSQAAPESQHSIATKQNGVLFAGVPIASLTGQHSVVIYTSADNGVTWTIVPLTIPSSLNPVVKTKMVSTSADNILCFILQDNTLYIINAESGVQGQFTTTGVQDFDAAAGLGNFVYVFVQESGSNTIKRYGTNDGGLTWTGNTATVTSNGSRPKVHMTGMRLILNYYGPVLADTVSSVIRAAFYDEGVPGTITPGTFSDVVTNNTVKKKQFQTIIINGFVWFFYTEGDAQQVLKCRVSSDNGATYQPEFVVAGNAQINAHWFSASVIFNSGLFGVALTYLADSIAPVGTAFDQMIYCTSFSAAPSVFTTPPSPFNTYNDAAVSGTPSNTLPVMLYYTYNVPGEAGVLWVGENSTGSSLYFDRFSATVGIQEDISNLISLNIFPSPANNVLNVTYQISDVVVNDIKIYSMDNKLVLQMKLSSNNASQQIHQIDVSGFTQGNYLLKATTSKGDAIKKFAIVK